MTQKREQLNLRLDKITKARIKRLKVAIKESSGVEVTAAHVVRLALVALDMQYLANGRKEESKP